MLHIPALPAVALDRIADEVFDLLPDVVDPLMEYDTTTEATLGEAMPVWRVVPETLHDPTEHLTDVAEPILRWHHQLLLDDQPFAFVRSTTTGLLPDDATVAEIWPGPDAAAITEALAWVEKSAFAASDTRYTVRLLATPVYQLLSLWLAADEASDDTDQVVVVAEPYGAFERLIAYDAAAFLGRLRVLPPIGGIELD